MSTEKRKSDAITTAIQTEKDGLELYQRAAEIAQADAAKQMFKMLISEEEKHIEIIQQVAAGRRLAPVLEEAGPSRSSGLVETIFTDAKQNVEEKVPPTTDEQEAIQMALDFEKRGYEFYKQAAADATDPDEEALFRSLADWEDEHYEILQRARDYLSDAGHWFMWEEGGPIEG